MTYICRSAMQPFHFYQLASMICLNPYCEKYLTVCSIIGMQSSMPPFAERVTVAPKAWGIQLAKQSW